MDRSDFKLVLQSIDAEHRGEIRRELARSFSIDEEIAGDIIGAAPIILLADLSLGAAAAIRGRVVGIEERGGRIVMTDAACDDIPKVNWPEAPQVARVSAAEAAGRTPAWRELASFRCPTCGETMKLVRAREEEHGAPGPTVVPPAHATPPPAKPEPAPVSAAPAAAPLAAAKAEAAAPEPFASERSVVIPGAATRRPTERSPERTGTQIMPVPLFTDELKLAPSPAPRSITTAPTASVILVPQDLAPPPPARPSAPEATVPPPARVPAAPPPAPAPAPAATRDPGPLVRALEEARERRESARIPSASSTPVQIPRPLPSKLASEDTDAFDRLELDAIARGDDLRAPIVPAAPPAPAAPPPPASSRILPVAPPPAAPPPPAAAVLDDFGSFDIDEALRLLDNAPDAPAPAGAAAAPPPERSSRPPSSEELMKAPPRRNESSDTTELGEIDFGLDLDEMPAVPVPAPAPAPAPAARPAAPGAGGHAPGRVSPGPARAPEPPPREMKRAAQAAPAPVPPVRAKRGSSEELAPLDPNEALAILESVKAPSSDEAVFSRPPIAPVSDTELEPLDPNEALAILKSAPPSQRLTAQRPAAAPAPAARPAAPAPKPAPQPATALSKSRELQRVPAAPPPAAAKSAEAGPQRIALTAADLEESDELPMVEPPPAPERGPSSRNQNSKTLMLGERATLRPAGASGGGGPSKRPSGERMAAKKPIRQPDDAEPVHGLVLSKIAGDARRQKAAELISEIANVTRDEALKLTDRTIIPVLKGVSREEAEAALARFQRSKISGRVTTRRLGE